MARASGVNHETLRVWVREAEQAARPGAGEASTVERVNRALRARVRELELEREILRRAEVFRRRDQLVSRFQFVEDHPGAFDVKRGVPGPVGIPRWFLPMGGWRRRPSTTGPERRCTCRADHRDPP